MKTDYYVYMYFRLNGTPCYVGKGRRFRWLEHARLGVNHYNKHFANIFRQAGTAYIPRLILRSGLTNNEAGEIEYALIAAIGRQQDGGPLVNLADGGAGSSGWHHSPDAKERIAQAVAKRAIKNETREKLRQANLGKRGFKHSAAFCELIRRTHAGRVKTPEECEAIRRSKIGHVVSPETRMKISAALAGKKRKPLSIEHKAKLSAAKTIKISPEASRAA